LRPSSAARVPAFVRTRPNVSHHRDDALGTVKFDGIAGRISAYNPALPLLKSDLAAWGRQPFRQSYLRNLGIEPVHRYGPADLF
jgi:hypothetical protein